MPGSPGPAVALRGAVYPEAAAGLLDAVQRAGCPSERVVGEPFFAHLAAHLERAAHCQRWVADRSRAEAGHVVAVCALRRFRRLVDVGPGSARC